MLRTKNPALAFGDDEFIYIDISSVENGTGKIDFSNKIKGSNAPSRAKRAVKKGDILFFNCSPPNLKAYGYVEREDFDCCVASTGFAVISAKNMVLSKYVYYMLYSEPVQAQLASMMGKGAYLQCKSKGCITNSDSFAAIIGTKKRLLLRLTDIKKLLMALNK